MRWFESDHAYHFLIENQARRGVELAFVLSLWYFCARGRSFWPMDIIRVRLEEEHHPWFRATKLVGRLNELMMARIIQNCSLSRVSGHDVQHIEAAR